MDAVPPAPLSPQHKDPSASMEASAHAAGTTEGDRPPSHPRAMSENDATSEVTEEETEGRLNMMPFPPPISQRVKRIVFTGGPSGGQTTAITSVAERLRSMGLQVFVLPDAAQLMNTAGGGIGVCMQDGQQRKNWVRNVLRMQITTEDALVRVAESSGRSSVMLYDRGCMDVARYCTSAEWEALLTELATEPEFLANIPAHSPARARGGSDTPKPVAVAVAVPIAAATVTQTLLERYDAVVHLRTICVPPRGVDPTAHAVPPTIKDVQETIAVDSRLVELWKDHPYVNMIENPPSGGMDEKTQHAVSEICHYLGVQSPMLCKQQFLVDLSLIAKLQQPDWKWVHEYLDHFHVEITFLNGSTPQSNTYLRRRICRKEALGEADSFVECFQELAPATPLTPLWTAPAAPPADGAPLPAVDDMSPQAGQAKPSPGPAAPKGSPFATSGGTAGTSAKGSPSNSFSASPPVRLVCRESLITQREYSLLLETQVMPGTRTLDVNRRCFCYKMHWFQLDYFKQAGVLLLEVESQGKESPIPFPQWLKPHIKKKLSGTPDEPNFQPFKLAGCLDTTEHPRSPA